MFFPHVTKYISISMKNSFFIDYFEKIDLVHIEGNYIYFFFWKKCFCPYDPKYQHIEEEDVLWDHFEKIIFCLYLQKYQHIKENYIFFLEKSVFTEKMTWPKISTFLGKLRFYEIILEKIFLFRKFQHFRFNISTFVEIIMKKSLFVHIC